MNIKNILNVLGGKVESTDDEIEEMEEEENSNLRKVERKNYESEQNEKKVRRMYLNKKIEGSNEPKMSDSMLTIIRPNRFDEVKIICEAIRNKKIVTFSLDKVDQKEGQRIIDAAYGAALAMNTKLISVREGVITCAPKDIGVDNFNELESEFSKENEDIML